MWRWPAQSEIERRVERIQLQLPRAQQVLLRLAMAWKPKQADRSRWQRVLVARRQLAVRFAALRQLRAALPGEPVRRGQA
jgi:hypothetical protein